MKNMGRLQSTVKPIALSDCQKNALATAIREAGENAPPVETLCAEIAKPAAESPLAQSEELLFIL